MRQLKITKQITRRDELSLEKYLQDITPIPLISAEREAELAIRIQKGDQRAKDELVRSNLRFVVSVAKQYQNQGMSLPDLISTGNLGLIKAAGRFDHTKGFKFISYAVWWIRQMILQGISDQSRSIRLPLNKIGSINKIKRATSELEQMHERAPSIYELAEKLNTSPKDIELCLRSAQRTTSLDSPVSSEEQSTTFGQLITDDSVPPPDSHVDLESVQQDVVDALKFLTPRESRLICLLYGIGTSHPHTLEEIALQFEVTRERVRQIKDKAIRRLRIKSKTEQLQEHLRDSK